MLHKHTHNYILSSVPATTGPSTRQQGRYNMAKTASETASETPSASAPYEVFMSASGATLYVLGDKTFTSQTDADAYVAANQVGILVDKFMAYVNDNSASFFGNKKGEMPADRALLALTTRTKNTVTKFAQWLYTQQ